MEPSFHSLIEPNLLEEGEVRQEVVVESSLPEMHSLVVVLRGRESSYAQFMEASPPPDFEETSPMPLLWKEYDNDTSRQLMTCYLFKNSSNSNSSKKSSNFTLRFGGHQAYTIEMYPQSQAAEARAGRVLMQPVMLYDNAWHANRNLSLTIEFEDIEDRYLGNYLL